MPLSFIKKGITMEEKLTQEEVQEKVDNLKQEILDNKIQTTKIIHSLNVSTSKLQEYKAKKTKARKRNKIQKISRKKNR